MKYTNRSSVGEGSVQSAGVHRLVKAFVDKVWSDKKKYIHRRSQSMSPTYRSFIDQSNLNWSCLIGVCFRHPSLNPVNDSQTKDYPAHTLIRDNKCPITLNGWSVPFLNAMSRPVPSCVLEQGWRKYKITYIYYKLHIYIFFFVSIAFCYRGLSSSCL